MSHAGARPYVWMLCGCGWFAGMGLTAHALAGRCDWQTVALFRGALATVFAAAVALAAGVPLVFARPRTLWIRSVAGSVSMVAGFYAFSRLDVSTVLTITNTFPIWVALLSWPVARERPSRGVWLAVGCSVVGVFVALRPGGEGFAWLPAGAALLASFCTAVAMLGLNRLKGVAPLAVIVHFSAVSTAFALLSYFVFDRDAGVGPLADWGVALRLLAVGATGTVGQVFLTKAFASGSATKVSVVGLSQVIMVMALEAALGWKGVGAWDLVGTALVLGPVGWLMARERRPPKQPGEVELAEAAIE